MIDSSRLFAFCILAKAWLTASLIISLFFGWIAVISKCESVEATNTMSKFRKFGLPRLLDGTSPGQPKPKVEGSDGIPRFDCNKLVIKDRIGHGAFGDVFTADYQAPGKDSKETVVIKKMINVMDAEEKKLFLK